MKQVDKPIIVLTFIIAGLAVIGLFIDIFFYAPGGFSVWLREREWGTIYVILTILFSLINFSLIGFMAWSIRKYALLAKEPPPPSAAPILSTPPIDEVRKNWEHIRGLANSANPSDWNMAVLRADALLDDILMHLGYEGTTMAERLKIVDPTKLLSLERVWSAHRLRNMIAHDPLEQHTRETIVHALRSYEQALRELGMFGAAPPAEEQLQG